MLPFQSLISINKNQQCPVYQQIAGAIIQLIRNGTLKPGIFIPSSRALAELLAVHRKTVVAAYEELSAQDWIETIPRKGIMVAKHLPELKPRTFKAIEETAAYKSKPVNFFQRLNIAPLIERKATNYRYVINDGFPDPRIAPVDLMLRQYRYLLKRPNADKQIMFGDNAGSPNLRNALANFLSDSRGLNIQANNILITRGAQMAIYTAARLILKPGSTVMVGELSYGMANQIFEEFGAKLVKVPVDEQGMDVEAIEKIVKKKKPDLLYIIPHHHHPTTVTLSAARRMKLLSLIREYKLPVIEDDYDYDFHYARSPILPLASANHGGYVIYIGSFTKCFASSMRLGYLVATEDFVKSGAELRKLIDIRGDVLMEETLAMMLNNGEMQKHLKKSLKLYKQRRDLFCELLEKELGDKVSFNKPGGGMSVWVRFDKRYNLKKVSEKAASLGLFMRDGSAYNSPDKNLNALRMGFASLNEKEIKGVIGILKQIL